MTHLEDRIDWALSVVKVQVLKAYTKHPTPMHSGHEGYGVILEELDEAWDEIKANNSVNAFDEMSQVGSMAVRFMLDVGP